jgi:superfamily I DNA and RNA helicase
VYKIQGTAGSGKTQLALVLLKDAVEKKQRCAYVCYNRPLADHIAKVAPHQAEVSTIHELSINYYRKVIGEPDFNDPSIFDCAISKYIEESESSIQNLDLLIIDESQDFEPDWISAVISRLKAESRLYVMTDQDQNLYGRDSFDLPDAVEIVCNDNFRSPQKIVNTINQLQLTKQIINSKGIFQGEVPEFITYKDLERGGVKEIEIVLNNLLKEGHELENITLISFEGRKTSKILRQESIGKYKLSKFSGHYDRDGSPIWSKGELLAETIYRFKGQSAPIILFCEIDFNKLNEKILKKLFVAFTRSTFKLICILSKQSEATLLERISNNSY